MQLNLRQLSCFHALMACGTTTGAAELLHMSQPAVSTTISNLEHQLGFELFTRSKGRLLPTPEAHHFHIAATQTLDSLERTVDVAREIRDGRLGHLTIATYPGIAIQFLPRLLGLFLAERPRVRVKLLSRSSSIIRELFPAQQFDVGISEMPVDNSAVDVEVLSFECVCVMDPGNELASESILTPEKLDGRSFVSLFREHSTYHQLAIAFNQAKKRWNVAVETEYFESACSSAAAGVGIAVVDPVTASLHTEGEILIRPFKPPIRYELGILVPREQPPSRLTIEFVELLKRRLMPFTLRDDGCART